LRDRDKDRVADDLSLLQAKYDKDKVAWAWKEKTLEVEKQQLGI